MCMLSQICVLVLEVVLISGECLETDIEDICHSVRKSDEYLCELLREPRPCNGNKIIPGINKYINCFNQLAQCLDVFTNQTLQKCEEVFEEQGANFMHIRFDRDDLINGFQWGEKDMEVYESWRGKTLDAWLQCESHIYQHPSLDTSEA